jgi:hypothetical protein
MKTKEFEVWIAVFAAEYVRLRAAGALDMQAVAEEAGRVADLAVRALHMASAGRPQLLEAEN